MTEKKNSSNFKRHCTFVYHLHTTINLADFEPIRLMLPLFLHISMQGQNQVVLFYLERLSQPGPHTCRSSLFFSITTDPTSYSLQKFRICTEPPKNPDYHHYPLAQDHWERGATASTLTTAAKQKKRPMVTSRKNQKTG